MVPSCLLAIICSPLHVTEHEGKKDVLGLLVSLLLLSVVQSISVYTGATRSASKRSRKNLWPREDKASKFNSAVAGSLSSRGIHFVYLKIGIDLWNSLKNECGFLFWFPEWTMLVHSLQTSSFSLAYDL